PPSERGRAIGITVAAVYMGLSAGPFAADYLANLWGWRSLFGVTFPLGLVSIYLAVTMIKDEWRVARGQPLDLVGVLFYGCCLILLMIGLSHMPGAWGAIALTGAAACFYAFVRQEIRTPYPVVEIGLFQHNRGFSFSSLAALINYAATFAVAFYLSLYLQYIKSMPPQRAGLILITQPVVMALFSPLAGRFSDRFEPASIASLGMVLCACGLLLLSRLNGATNIPYIVATLLLLGLGFALFSSPNMNAIMSSVAPAHYGLASGTVATMRLIGQMLSMAIATLLFAVLIGGKQITPETYPAFLRTVRLGFAVCCGLCLIGTYFSWNRGAIRNSTNP
ncbi:MAG: MFS transporter, partial [Thermodesulfobacteriota bacterium]